MGATYSQILSQSKATRPNEVEGSPPETKSTEVQTDPDESFFEKLRECLLSVLSQDIISASPPEKEQRLDKAIQDTFGMKIPCRKRRASDTSIRTAEDSSDQDSQSIVKGNIDYPTFLQSTRNSNRKGKKKKPGTGASNSKNA